MAEQELLGLGAKDMQPPPSKRDRDFAVSKRSRGRSGCLNCRRRRKKCDEGKPACGKCTMRGESCEWDTRITFRLSGIGTYNPSRAQPRSLSTQSDYQFMNVAFDNGTATTQHTYADQQDVMSQHSSSSSNDQLMLDAHDRHRNNRSANLHDHEPTSISSSRETGHGAAPTSSSLEKNSRSRMIGTSTNFHMSNAILREPSTASVKSSNYSSPNEIEQNTGRLPVSLPQIRVPRPANQLIEYPSPQMGTMTRFDCLDPLNDETNSQPQSGAITSQLEALDYLTTQPNHFDFFSSTETRSDLMQCYSKDGTTIMPSPFVNGLAMAESPDRQPVPYSSATYQDLHTTLYHHMLETVRNTTRTRNASPDPVAQGGQTVVHNNTISPSSSVIDDIRSQAREPSLRLQPLKLVKLTKRRQLELWRNYLDEIAVWLDMFDNDRHFQFQIPHLAKSADHLHYSILALSARQMERKNAGKPYTESLALYQEAIQLIVKELYTLDTTVIASCVLLCVLEMMSSSPRAWCRHLDGCAMLLEAAGVNGVVGGVRESLFWCFARMDVWGGYLEDTLTKIPTSRWFIPSGSMMEAVTYLKAGSGSHSHANYAVFLCASVVNVISNKSGADVGQAEGDSARRGTYAARWQALFDLLEDWYNNRTEEMQPLMTFASGSDDSRDPFSTILYGSSPAINGNQLYHAAALLLLQNKPKGLRLAKSPRSILWHARQICGIAVSNSDHGALINCLQPLWIAGKLMSHESEHSAILDLLAQIEKDTGWATAWRAEDLKDYWGDLGYSDTQ